MEHGSDAEMLQTLQQEDATRKENEEKARARCAQLATQMTSAQQLPVKENAICKGSIVSFAADESPQTAAPPPQ